MMMSYLKKCQNPENGNLGIAEKSDGTINAMLQNKGLLVLYPALINQNKAMVLRDSGCSSVCVDKRYVNEQDIMTSKEKIKLGDGKSIECSTAKIHIDTPWITGEVVAIILDKPIAPLVLGNIPGIVQEDYTTILQQWLLRKEKECDIVFPPGKCVNVISNDDCDNENTNNFGKWNGSEEISQYINRLENSVNQNSRSQGSMNHIFRDKLSGHRAAYKIATEHINNYDGMKCNLIHVLNKKVKLSDDNFKNHNDLSENKTKEIFSMQKRSEKKV